MTVQDKDYENNDGGNDAGGVSFNRCFVAGAGITSVGRVL